MQTLTFSTLHKLMASFEKETSFHADTYRGRFIHSLLQHQEYALLLYFLPTSLNPVAPKIRKEWIDTVLATDDILGFNILHRYMQSTQEWCIFPAYFIMNAGPSPEEQRDLLYFHLLFHSLAQGAHQIFQHIFTTKAHVLEREIRCMVGDGARRFTQLLCQSFTSTKVDSDVLLMMKTLQQIESVLEPLIYGAIVKELVTQPWPTDTLEIQPILRVWFFYLENKHYRPSTLSAPTVPRQVIECIYPAYRRMKQIEYKGWVNYLDLCTDIIQLVGEYNMLTIKELQQQINDQHLALNPNASRKNFTMT